MKVKDLRELKKSLPQKSANIWRNSMPCGDMDKFKFK